MKYYYVEDKKAKGPYSIEQLAEIGISPDTLVWCKRMTNWVKASEVEELSDIMTLRAENLNAQVVNDKQTMIDPAQINDVGIQESLIPCSECGHMISDKAVRCPKCGCPTKEETVRQHNNAPSNDTPVYDEEESHSNKWLYVVIAVLLITIVVGGCILYSQSKENQDRNQFVEQFIKWLRSS